MNCLLFIRPCANFVSHSVVSDSSTPWTVAHQASLSMEFSRREYWSGLPFLSPGDLPDSGMEPKSPHCRQILYHLSYREVPTRGRKRENVGSLLSVSPSSNARVRQGKGCVVTQCDGACTQIYAENTEKGDTRPGGSGEPWQSLKEVSWREGRKFHAERGEWTKTWRARKSTEKRHRGILEPLWKYFCCQITTNLVAFVFAVQLLNHVELFATLWTAAHQEASPSITISSSLRFMSTKSMMVSNHLIR